MVTSPVDSSAYGDVVVIAPSDDNTPTFQQPTSLLPDQAVFSRQAAADARFFGSCINPRDAEWLRLIVDNPLAHRGSGKALDALVRRHAPCYPGLPSPIPWQSDFFGICYPRGLFIPVIDRKFGVVGARPVNTICQAFYDRGAIIERVLTLYAADLQLTRDLLEDATVVARFRARQARFDQARTSRERQYAAVVACLVEAKPSTARALTRANPNTIADAKLRTALIDATPACYGGAKSILVDPSQFRVFVADALYGWAVAVRGTDSLIPPT